MSFKRFVSITMLVLATLPQGAWAHTSKYANQALHTQKTKSKGTHHTHAIKRHDVLNSISHHLPTVFTSPHIGLRSAYDASDLTVNLPSMNEDLRLLKQRQRFTKSEKGDYLYRNRPVIELGGKLEGQVSSSRSLSGTTISDVNLTTAALDTLIQVSPWALGFITLEYDDNALDPALTGFGTRTANSKVFLKRGFLTIGNLDQSPLYLTIGQIFVDFGRYASSMVSAPLTLALGRINERAIQLGYYHDGFFASIYAFRGDSHTGNTGTLKQGGVNTGYAFKYGNFSGNIGGGYVNNLADSGGLQNTGNSAGTFQGFGLNSSTETLLHRVPAANAHGEFSYGSLSFMGEYIGSVTSFNPADLSFKGKGARPQAMHLEIDHTFILIDKPSSIGFGYDRTWQAYAANLPKHAFTIVFNTSLWKNTIESIEFRHNENYSSADALGSGGRCGTAGTSFCSVPFLGKHSNTILAQIGVYF